MTTNYTYTVLYMDSEVSFGEGESFEYAREEALENVPAMYPQEDLMFSATCNNGMIGEVTGPCYF